ncbi:hypothetical protein MYSI104531_23340 [Mycobacterium simiae]
MRPVETMNPRAKPQWHGGSEADGHSYPSRSMMVALAMPPPSHIVCSP